MVILFVFCINSSIEINDVDTAAVNRTYIECHFDKQIVSLKHHCEKCVAVALLRLMLLSFVVDSCDQKPISIYIMVEKKTIVFRQIAFDCVTNLN